MDLADLDLDALPDEQLRSLHNRAAEILNARTDARVRRRMSEFRFGDPVWFEHERGPGGRVLARVQKTNRKTVSVVDEHGGRWNVAPTLLRHLEPEPANEGTSKPAAAAPPPSPAPPSAGLPHVSREDLLESLRKLGIDPAEHGFHFFPPPSAGEPPSGGRTPTPPPAKNRRKRKRRR